MYRIKLQNTVTNQEYTYDNVIDKNNGKKLFFNFDIDTSNLDNGEYKLTLFDGDNIVCTELLKIGDFNSDKIQYSKGNNIYINAKPDIELSEIAITENGEYNALSNNAWNKINVNISPKVDVAAAGIKFGYSQLTEIPDYFDFSNVGDFNHMFSNCNNLTSLPDSLENCKPNNVEYMYNECYSLKQFPKIDLTNVQLMNYMHSFCYEMVSAPDYDYSNIQYVSQLFYFCSSLTEIPNLDTTYKVMMMDYFLCGCSSLTELPIIDCTSVLDGGSPFGWETLNNLTSLGGFKNLKCNFYGGDFLNMLPNLTVDSLMNVINNLWDWTDYPDGIVYNEYYNQNFDYGTDHTLSFGQTNLDKLTPEQIAVATSKGWTLI